jgi:chromatin remodeling complex protein RSC6
MNTPTPKKSERSNKLNKQKSSEDDVVKKVKKVKKVVEKEPEPPTPEPEPQPPTPEPEPEPEHDDTLVKERKVVSRDTVLEEFDSVLSVIDAEIEVLRKTPKCGGVKFLRSLVKQIKIIRANSARVMKKKTKTERKNPSNSGFLKPVNISNEMAKFTGWNPSEPRSRVEVTKYICDYIKENNLQNPDDRRQIRPDPKLQKLLGLKGKEDHGLKYYSLQTHLKRHFVKPE